MLHKAPKFLAITSGLFVVGVLVYTANNRFGGDNFHGQLVPEAGAPVACPDQVRPVPPPKTFQFPVTLKNPPDLHCVCKTQAEFMTTLKLMRDRDPDCKTTADISCGPSTCVKDGAVTVTTQGPIIVGGALSKIPCAGKKPQFCYKSYSYSCTRTQKCKSTVISSSMPRGWRCCANATTATCQDQAIACPSGQSTTDYSPADDCSFRCVKTPSSSSSSM